MTTTKRAGADACSLLDADRGNVKKMFTAYEDLTMADRQRNGHQPSE